jgi:preprotein translocase subunit SecD
MASVHGTDRVTLRVGSRKYVLGPVVVDDAGVSNAKVVDSTVGGSGASLQLQLTPAATFAAATQQAVTARPPRNEIAMLIDGEIVSAPTVQAVIRSGSVQFGGSFTRERAQQIAGGLNASA